MGPHSPHSRTVRTLVRFDQGPEERFIGGFTRLPRVLLDLLLLWQQRASDRTRLEHLTDRDLRDIGLSRAQIEAEADKPFWRP